jgi:hypothetical protein
MLCRKEKEEHIKGFEVVWENGAGSCGECCTVSLCHHGKESTHTGGRPIRQHESVSRRKYELSKRLQRNVVTSLKTPKFSSTPVRASGVATSYCFQKQDICLAYLFGTAGLRPNYGQGLIIDVARSYTATHQSVGLLWTSDQLIAEKSTGQHTTLTTQKHPCPRWDPKLVILAGERQQTYALDGEPLGPAIG